jgi:hypothetical protein
MTTEDESTVLARIVNDIDTVLQFYKPDPATGRGRFVTPTNAALLTSLVTARALILQQLIVTKEALIAELPDCIRLAELGDFGPLKRLAEFVTTSPAAAGRAPAR